MPLHYDVQHGVIRTKPKRRRIFWVLPLLIVMIGMYVAALVVSPMVADYIPPKDWNYPVPHTPTLTEDRLYIPKLKLNLTYKADDASMFDGNAWWRQPDSGNPSKGGNFVLAAQRFRFGLTPDQTKRNSPFYRLDKLEQGDKIFVDYKGKRYEYTVKKRYRVDPKNTTIETTTTGSRMTLYGSTPQGAADGQAIDAEQTGKNIDASKLLKNESLL